MEVRRFTIFSRKILKLLRSNLCGAKTGQMAAAVQKEGCPENDFERNATSDVCKPIKSLKELYETIEAPPEWTKNTIPKRKRCDYVIKNEEGDCHVKESDFSPKLRIKRNVTPRTLICHDMMGGYLLDKYIGGINQGNGFTFHRWAHTDIFCYFSHHFVTVPTLPWINLGHLHGNAVIGTVITEHTEGVRLCSEIFQNDRSYEKFADGLVEVCFLCKFDGWLLNIENSVERPDLLLRFVKYLTEKMHRKIPGSYVIWYDSVISDGTLAWQNELNEKNRCYFDACDGIYLNYGWQEKEMERTKEAAKDRAFDVYVGIDIWGRGSYGGGTFHAYKAAKVIADFNMSMAIFAHGWEHEANPKTPENNFLKRYYSRSSLLWKLFWPYMYTTPIENCFSTFFKTGVTSEHYDLESQDVQPSYFPSHTVTVETRNADNSESICRCVQERLVDQDRFLVVCNKDVDGTDVVHRLFATQIRLADETCVDVYTESYDDCDCDYELIFLAADSTNKIVKIVEPIADDKNRSASNVPDHWDHRCYILNYPNYELLEIGIKLVGGNYLNLCGFSISTK